MIQTIPQEQLGNCYLSDDVFKMSKDTPTLIKSLGFGLFISSPTISDLGGKK